MNRLLLLLALLLAAPLASAQPIDVDELDALFGNEPQVEVNLRGSLLRLASEAASGESPEVSAMIDGLRSVTVRVYPAPEDVRGLAVERFSLIGDRFEDAGWFTLVRVRAIAGTDNDDGDVWVYVRDSGDSFDGMAVMAVDTEDDTAVFVFIDGTIDPAQVGELSRRFARVDLDDEDDDE